jgi:hypothetical protein
VDLVERLGQPHPPQGRPRGRDRRCVVSLHLFRHSFSGRRVAWDCASLPGRAEKDGFRRKTARTNEGRLVTAPGVSHSGHRGHPARRRPSRRRPRAAGCAPASLPEGTTAMVTAPHPSGPPARATAPQAPGPRRSAGPAPAAVRGRR